MRFGFRRFGERIWAEKAKNLSETNLFMLGLVALTLIYRPKRHRQICAYQAVFIYFYISLSFYGLACEQILVKFEPR